MEKVALVTGGSKGLGLAIVESLSKSCDKVIATYNKTNPKIALPNVVFKQLDISSKQECDLLLSELKEENIFPNILVNNAGITQDGMFHKMDFDAWQSVITTNLTSLFHLTQPVFKQMRELGFGRIINISSVNANKGQMGQVNYCASKAGIQGFTKALALEGAAKGVTVNTISPGYCETDMVAAIPSDVLDKIKNSIPQKRLGQPNEVASLVNFLVSTEAEYITGANLEINGGLYSS
ncbi:hypothetical protein N473_05690 [Pseudoalteromonas luteoviolacea CPMOR-1]|uniref:Ketoreductase domain-containing protein n=1 Tax=Pseudoalteromonas luteoviolacea CPMOR-1 TaxID=1365248 RepID=A0A167HKD7_9GAMM|nr:acetoacetyl-CoA reductase [Pseudoalteromonas luteoviolacea]KZN58233.1 hypothetical protein N473_05690 [Pseudoalteromonas luteoviolacea CPMOR-1]